MGRRVVIAFAGACIAAATIALAAEPQPHITVSPASDSYGGLCLGDTSAKTFTITNDGTTDVEITAITKSESGAEDFVLSVPSSSTPPFTLAQAEKSTFSVTFRPVGRGSLTASVRVTWRDDTNNQSQPDVNVSLSGTGVDRKIATDAASVSFGEQRVGTRSPTKSLLVRNPGQDVVTVSAVDRGGAAGGEFVLTPPSLPFTIAPGDFRSLAVAFQPLAAGLRTGTLVITSNACGQPAITTNLVGTGIVPDVAVLPSPIDAGATPKGSEGPAIPVTVSSNGGTPLKVTGVQIVGPDAKDFALSGLPQFPLTIQPQDAFVFSVRMTPSAEGLRVATLNVVSDDPDSPTTAVPLRGSGGPATPSPTPSTIPTSTASASPTPTRSAVPRGAPGTPNDALAIWLVVGGVLGAFGGLVAIRRRVGAGGEET